MERFGSVSWLQVPHDKRLARLAWRRWKARLAKSLVSDHTPQAPPPTCPRTDSLISGDHAVSWPGHTRSILGRPGLMVCLGPTWICLTRSKVTASRLSMSVSSSFSAPAIAPLPVVLYLISPQCILSGGCGGVADYGYADRPRVHDHAANTVGYGALSSHLRREGRGHLHCQPTHRDHDEPSSARDFRQLDEQ